MTLLHSDFIKWWKYRHSYENVQNYTLYKTSKPVLTVLLQASFNCSTFDYKEHSVDTLITTCTDFYYSSYVLKKWRYLFVLNNMFIQCFPTFVTHAHEQNANYFGAPDLPTDTTQVLHLTIHQDDEQMPAVVVARAANGTNITLNQCIALIWNHDCGNSA